MTGSETSFSEIFSQPKTVFEHSGKYLLKANSGRGKTSLLNFIYGSNLNFDGEITFYPSQNNSCELRRTKISYVFQDFKLFPNLSLIDNILLKNALTNHKNNEEIFNLIDQVNLYDKRNSLLSSMSLGQRQRVAIIRALCQPFEILLLDEPFSHLDNHNINTISKIIIDEIEKNNSSLLLTSLECLNQFDFNKVYKL